MTMTRFRSSGVNDTPHQGVGEPGLMLAGVLLDGKTATQAAAGAGM